jgi:hypothetical protein
MRRIRHFIHSDELIFTTLILNDPVSCEAAELGTPKGAILVQDGNVIIRLARHPEQKVSMVFRKNMSGSVPDIIDEETPFPRPYSRHRFDCKAQRKYSACQADASSGDA